MSPTPLSSVSVVMVSHNSVGLIEPVLDSLFSAPERPGEVIVVDSASTDNTLQVLSGYDVTVHPNAENVGFAQGCHLGVGASKGEVIVFLGHDTIPKQGWLHPLVDALSEDVGAVMATIEEADAPGTFNTSGGILTYFGIASISDQGEPIPDTDPPLVEVPFPSGAAMAISRSIWQRFGGFRQDFFMYHEDTDLGWRLRLAGLRVLRASHSRVTHHYEFGRSPRKMYFLERNRWLMLRANYRPLTLALLAPALVLVEAGIVFVAVRDGWFSEKWRACRDAIRPPAKRRLADSNRKLTDAEMLESMGHKLSGIDQVRPPSGTELIERLLGVWQRVVVVALRSFQRG